MDDVLVEHSRVEFTRVLEVARGNVEKYPHDGLDIVQNIVASTLLE